MALDRTTTLLERWRCEPRRPCIAALNAELHSNDGDFARFPELRWTNPVA